MKEPVVVIHGVANRNQPIFEETVRDFNHSISEDFEFLPVYWGDLAANESVVDKALPVLEAEAFLRAARGADSNLEAALLADLAQPDSVIDNETQAQIIREAALPAWASAELAGSAQPSSMRAARGPAAGQPGAEEAAALQQAIEEQLPHTGYLQYISDPALLRSVGSLVGKAVAGQSSALHSPDNTTQPTTGVSRGSASEPDAIERTGRLGTAIRGAGSSVAHITAAGAEHLKNLARGIISDIDRMMGEVAHTSFSRVNETLRENVLPGFTRLIGDIFVYQRHPQKIQGRIWQAIKAYQERTGTTGWGKSKRPINVIAHSLGGLVTLDAAISGRPQLHIKRYITFGSQPAFFHLIDPRKGVDQYEDEPVSLPPTIGEWTSFWEPMDLLAFQTRSVFRLGSTQLPTDIRVRVLQASELASSLFWTHSCYWTHESVINEIRHILTRTD